MSPIEIPQAHIAHREEFASFVKEAAEPWHREHLSVLYAHWEIVNKEYFAAELFPPHILLAEPKTPRALGDCASVSGWGSRSQIRIRPSLAQGNHRIVRSGPQHAEGRMRLLKDIVLHETVHQWQQEISGFLDAGYHGHGPHFRDEANRIGARLGLPPVRAAKARGKNKNLPSCAQWPHCVRPADYYLGAVLVEREEDETKEQREAAEHERVLQRAEVKVLEAARIYGEGPETDAPSAARVLAAARGYAAAVRESSSATRVERV